MICLHGHAWFLSSQREVWPCYVPTEDNLATDLLDKSNFPWCYCTRRLLNKRSNLWCEQPLWILFMISWREFFNRYKSVLCFQKVTTLASTFKCWEWCWSAVRVALPSLLIGKPVFFFFILKIFMKKWFTVLGNHLVQICYFTPIISTPGIPRHVSSGGWGRNRVNRVINQLTRALGAQGASQRIGWTVKVPNVVFSDD